MDLIQFKTEGKRLYYRQKLMLDNIADSHMITYILTNVWSEWKFICNIGE